MNQQLAKNEVNATHTHIPRTFQPIPPTTSEK